MYIHHHRGIIPPPIPWGGWEHGTRDHIYIYRLFTRQTGWNMLYIYIEKPGANGRRVLDYIRLPPEVTECFKICLKESLRICVAFMYLRPWKKINISSHNQIWLTGKSPNNFPIYIYNYIIIYIYVYGWPFIVDVPYFPYEKSIKTPMITAFRGSPDLPSSLCGGSWCQSIRCKTNGPKCCENVPHLWRLKMGHRRRICGFYDS